MAQEKELAEKIVKLEQEKLNLEKKLFQISDENGQVKAAVQVMNVLG